MTTIYVNSDKLLAAWPTRRAFDFYPTPIEVARDALTFLPSDFIPTRVLDPGAGSGVWGQAARERWRDAWMVGVEERDVHATPDYDWWLTQNYLANPVYDISTPSVSCVIGNPPYHLAEQFVRRSYDLLWKGGWLIFLLRLNFLEGKKRSLGLYRDLPLHTCVVRASRVSFTGDGKTNATAYGYFIWQKGWQGTTTLKWSTGL